MFSRAPRLPKPPAAPDPVETSRKEEEKLEKANKVRARVLQADNTLDKQFNVRKTGLKL